VALSGLSATTVGGAVGSYVITFAASQTLTASAGGLVGPFALVGTLSLATVGIEEAIGEMENIDQTFEIKLTPSGGDPQTVLQVPLSILNDLIPNAPAIPTPLPSYLTETQSDARYVQLTQIDTDGTMAADSDSRVASQKAIREYVAAHGGGGTVDSVVAGTNITVDATDPANPVVSATGGGGSSTPQNYLYQDDDFTAVEGVAYTVNSLPDYGAGVATVTLPASPSYDATIVFAALVEQSAFGPIWANVTYPVTFNGNGNTINATGNGSVGTSTYTTSTTTPALLIFKWDPYYTVWMVTGFANTTAL
jgi:hypothetical protein